MRPIRPLGLIIPLIFALAGCSAFMTPVEVSDRPDTPFKLATYTYQGERHVGMVFNDETIVNLIQAHRALQSVANVPAIKLPDDMLALLDLEGAVWPRLYQIANYTAGHLLNDPPVYVHRLEAVKFEAPILYPRKLLATAANYSEHRAEMAMAEPQPNKTVPYLFPKIPSVNTIATGDTVRIPPGRDRMDWEVELGVVIGKRAKDVPAEKAYDCVFGYTIVNDVSDRGGGSNPDFPGPNWFHGKTHDTAAPTGPFIVPRAFIPDPHNLNLSTKINDQVMQDSNTGYMIYTIPEIIAYASSILTLEPGDIILTGTPSGVGAGRGVFLKRGDIITMTIEKIGVLQNPVY